MSDRGDDTSAAPATHGAPTGPLPGPRPPVSGWPQASQYTGSPVPSPTPSQTTAPVPSRPTEAFARPTGSFAPPTNGYGPFGSAAPASAPPASAPPYGSGHPA